MLLGGIYAAVAAQAGDTPLADREEVRERVDEARRSGLPPFLVSRALRTQARQERFEQEVNQETLRRLRTAGLAGLSGILILSLGIGYVVAGRVLSPVSRITLRARELGDRAPDLSGRIDLGGPDDELRELSDTLDGFLDRTEAAVNSQRRFLADAAHELRTPVAAAKTTIDVVLEDPEADVEEHRRAEEVAQRQLARMGRLISDLLVLERRGNGAGREVVDLRDAARSAVDELAPLAVERGIAVEVVEGVPARAHANRDELARILVNLVENAIVHNRPEGTVRVACESAGPRVRVRVEDTGPGVAPERREEIFERFRRVSNDTRGTGLGLAIARELAREGDGDVTVDGEPGRGSTFTLELPAAPGGA